ncbi:MAG: aspartate aminotransferase [Arenicella sp.]|jgi:aspartate aminotransferase
MKPTLSDRILSLPESQTLAMAGKARELQAQGHEVIKLNLGEPDFQTPDHIKAAAKKALDDGYTFYPPVNGYPELRQAIADKFKRENSLDFTADQIVVSTGAKQSLANVLMCLLNDGDETVVLAPFWVSYAAQITLSGGTPIYATAGIEQDFKVTAEELEEKITSKTKVVMFSSPCNPTGSVFTKSELEAIAKVIEKHPQIIVISDEIYEHINFGGKHESIAQFDSIKDRVVIVNGFSKGYAMTGWRLGYIAAPVWLAKACNKMQGQITSGANSIAQRAAIEALNGDMAPTYKMRDAYLRRRDLVKGMLDKIEGLKTNNPQGAFYTFPDVSSYFGKSDGETTINNSYDFAMYLLNKKHVSVVDGEGFGAPDCIRISFAASDDSLKEAVKRIGEACGELK